MRKPKDNRTDAQKEEALVESIRIFEETRKGAREFEGLPDWDPNKIGEWGYGAWRRSGTWERAFKDKNFDNYNSWDFVARFTGTVPSRKWKRWIHEGVPEVDRTPRWQTPFMPLPACVEALHPPQNVRGILYNLCNPPLLYVPGPYADSGRIEHAEWTSVHQFLGFIGVTDESMFTDDFSRTWKISRMLPPDWEKDPKLAIDFACAILEDVSHVTVKQHIPDTTVRYDQRTGERIPAREVVIPRKELQQIFEDSLYKTCGQDDYHGDVFNNSHGGQLFCRRCVSNKVKSLSTQRRAEAAAQRAVLAEQKEAARHTPRVKYESITAERIRSRDGKRGFVYLATEVPTGKIYVGKHWGTQPLTRWIGHHLFKSYGVRPEDIRWETIATCESEDALHLLERKFIREKGALDPSVGYNRV
jgi:hypothetical protein